MRGKVSTCLGAVASFRITPAYAGKSKENTVQEVRKAGSPPPMRGKARLDRLSYHYIRITPAYAGKRFVLLVFSDHTQDHPRLCGEKTKKIPKQRYFFHQLASFSFSLQYT